MPTRFQSNAQTTAPHARDRTVLLDVNHGWCSVIGWPLTCHQKAQSLGLVRYVARFERVPCQQGKQQAGRRPSCSAHSVAALRWKNSIVV